MKKGPTMRKYFNPRYSNLNVHLDKEAYEEFKRDWPESHPVGLTQDSRHSPVFASMKDVITDEGKRWELISDCDINKYWSAMIGQFRGNPRAWFCEIAGSQSMAQQHIEGYKDTGIFPYAGWWKSPMEAFEDQVMTHCHNCGVPLRGYGELSQSETGVEVTTKTFVDIAIPKRSARSVKEASSLQEIKPQALTRMTDYIGNGSK